MPGPDIVFVDRTREGLCTATLSRVVRALQTQLDRDFGPVWGAAGRLVPAREPALAPAGWSISLVDRPGGGFGVRLGRDGGPRAAVVVRGDWTVALSHVLLEMLANPDGDLFIEGRDPTPGAAAHRVNYLVEVCDPCERFRYEISGVGVSDFVTPDYYRADAAPGTAFDFLRELGSPLELPRGGYLAWVDPVDRRWHQRRPDLAFVTSTAPINPARNPRADRDRAFPEDAGRHDIPALRRGMRGGGGVIHVSSHGDLASR
jgi:hypothetical protein